MKHYFPDGDFDAVLARAVEISTVFNTVAELKSALFHVGFLSAEKRAKHQLAALALNIAAGELFPGNTKCRLFLTTGIDDNGDSVADRTVGEALAQIESDILSGDPCRQQDAFELGLDINLGRNIPGAVNFH